MQRRKPKSSIPTVKIRSRKQQQQLPTHYSNSKKPQVNISKTRKYIIALTLIVSLFVIVDQISHSSLTSRLTLSSRTRTLTSCDNFDHGDTSPVSTVDSIFNCEYTQRCKIYYPAKFLHASCGIGKKFHFHLQQAEQLRQQGILWSENPPIVIPSVSLNPNVDNPHPILPVHVPLHNNEKEEEEIPDPFVFPTHNLSMIHVHKTGGTSLVTSFMDLHVPKLHDASRWGKKTRHDETDVKDGAPPPLPLPRRQRHHGQDGRNNFKPNIPPRKLAKGKQLTLYANNHGKITQNRDAVSSFLDGTVKYQSVWNETSHTLFAVVRDPVERFISQVGQVTSFQFGGRGIAKELRHECMKDTSRETLSCFVQLVRTNSTWIDVHFTPMVLEISFATMYKDIPVAIFPFKEVPSLVQELGGNSNEKIKDGHGDGYRSSDVFATMTVEDYDEESLRLLCEVYEMDVIMLNYLGFSSQCNDVVLDSY